MTGGAPSMRCLVPDDCIRTAASLFTRLQAAATLENTERLVHWLGQDPQHVRALDIALTQWGLAQSGHPAVSARGA